MSILKSRRPTHAQIAASRANAQKSTGPATASGKKVVSMNALKHGARAKASTRPLWQAMSALGEDPRRYRTLLQDVIRSYPPANPVERRLCEDITRMMLKSERNQQAQEAKLVRTYQKLESTRQKHLREIERQTSYDALQAEVLETGLRRAPDSPAKFSEATACLERLRTRVECGDFADETELNALYGKNPTFRGAGIINALRALAENPGNRDLAASLRLMILEEMRDIAEESELYYKEHVEISRAMRLECLAPAADREYVVLQRQEAAIHRQLERKIKLLVSLQSAGRRHLDKLDEGEDVTTGLPVVEEDPVSWMDPPAASPASSPPADGVAGSGSDGIARPAGDGTSQNEAHAIALRHKIDTPRASGPNDKERWANILNQINEIYGITPPPNPATGNAASEASSAGKGGQASTNSGAQDTSLKAGEEARGASDNEPN